MILCGCFNYHLFLVQWALVSDLDHFRHHLSFFFRSTFHFRIISLSRPLDWSYSFSCPYMRPCQLTRTRPRCIWAYYRHDPARGDHLLCRIKGLYHLVVEYGRACLATDGDSPSTCSPTCLNHFPNICSIAVHSCVLSKSCWVSIFVICAPFVSSVVSGASLSVQLSTVKFAWLIVDIALATWHDQHDVFRRGHDFCVYLIWYFIR